MSQYQKLYDGTALTDVETLTGDVGGAVPADATNNINLLTGYGFTTTGNPATNTITFDVDNQNQIIYVGKHGNDANNGRAIEHAFLTFGAAVTAAVALLPSATNRIVITCLDDGIYTENITGAQYVDFFCPKATYSGAFTVAGNSRIKFGAATLPIGSVGIAIIGVNIGTSGCEVDIDDISLTVDGNYVVYLASGTLVLNWLVMGATNITTTDLIHIDGNPVACNLFLRGQAITTVNCMLNVIRVWSTGPAFISGYINEIFGVPTAYSASFLYTGATVSSAIINLVINRVEYFTWGIYLANRALANIKINTLTCTSAIVVNGANAYLYLDVGSLTGTITNTGTLYYLRLNGTSSVQNLISTSLTDTSRTANAVSIYGVSGILSQVGPLTNGQLVIGSTGAAPVAAAMTNGNNITWTGGAGTLRADVTGTTNHAIQLGNASGSLTSASALTNGQLLIGNTGNDPTAATLTAGTGIGITNAAGSITLNVVGGGLTWTDIGASGNLAVNNGYNCTAGAALSLALPATSAVGDVIRVVLDGSTSWTITQAANQQIRIGAVTTTLGAGGSLASTAQGDAIEIVCKTANLIWTAVSLIGNLTVV